MTLCGKSIAGLGLLHPESLFAIKVFSSISKLGYQECSNDILTDKNNSGILNCVNNMVYAEHQLSYMESEIFVQVRYCFGEQHSFINIFVIESWMSFPVGQNFTHIVKTNHMEAVCIVWLCSESVTLRLTHCALCIDFALSNSSLCWICFVSVCCYKSQ